MNKVANQMTRLIFSAIVLMAVSAPFFAPVFAAPVGLTVINSDISTSQEK